MTQTKRKLVIAVWAFGGGIWLINVIEKFDAVSIIMLCLSLFMVALDIILE